MQYTLTQNKSEIDILVTIPFPEFEPQLQKAAVSISEEHEIEGFRKGKAPYDVVKNRFGEDEIYERAAELTIRKTYPELMRQLAEEQELLKTNPPIGRPAIAVTKLAPKNELEYKVTLALLPTVPLPDYHALAKKILAEKKEVGVTDEEIDASIKWLRESRAPLITVDRPAHMGDVVEIDFETRADGVKMGGGEGKKHLFVLGKGQFLPGFEDALVDMKVGDTKQFSLVAPDNWHDKGYAGKPLDFTVTLNLVQERQLPELTDAIVKSMGTFDSIDALKKSIRDGLLQEKKDKELQRTRGTLINAIADATPIEVPDALIRIELQKMFAELQQGIAQMGMQWTDYLSHIKKSVEDLEKEWREDAIKRVKIALCLREIAKKENIAPTEEEIEKEANDFLKRYESADQAQKDFDPEQLRNYTRDVLTNKQVFQFLETL